MQEIQVQSLGWEDSLENGMATHSSILAWRIPRIEESGGLYSSWGRKRAAHDLATKEQQPERSHIKGPVLEKILLKV